MKLRADSETRTVTEVGAGDFVKIKGEWKKIRSNSATGYRPVPRSWTVQTIDGNSYDMYSIQRYAKNEDIEMT